MRQVLGLGVKSFAWIQKVKQRCPDGLRKNLPNRQSHMFVGVPPAERHPAVLAKLRATVRDVVHHLIVVCVCVDGFSVREV